MSEERRQHKRVVKPFEGTWKGASGASPCRIADVSVSGCFVQSLALPTPGESTVVTIAFGQEHSLALAGTVVYVEPGMGFAVKFNALPDDELGEMRRFFEAIDTSRADA